ncbi:hypothetical protein ABPG77_003055 [Micractinium sp. CCAP 211/92]
MLSSLRVGGPTALRRGVAALRPAAARAPLRCLASKGGRKKDAEESVYSKTVNLPQTKFDMRANSVVREPQLQQFWQDNRIYEQLSRENPGPAFTLHDGPPYANGDLHIGHALNKILKDIINRYQLLQGRKAKFVPGWDCHGLPIELKVLQSMKEAERRSLTPLQLREKAAEFALKTVDAQREQFKRYGVWADWDAPYVTLDPSYEAAQLRVFGQMVLNGHIYRGRKPVHWSPSSRTALAEAELEYPEGHTSRSIYVAMPLTATGPKASEAAQAALEGAHFAIWTTTPWTIPANLAVAINDALDYSIVEVQGDLPEGWQARRLIVAADLAAPLAEKFGVTLSTLATVKGAELEGCTYRHPLFDREDYQVGQRYGLPLLSPVDDAGVFTEEAGPFAGLQALAEAGVLLLEEKYAHKYPYDWRTKKPTIFRATDQWFASVEGFRSTALEAIRGVHWIPAAVAEQGSDAWWRLDIADLLPEHLRSEAPKLRKGEDTMDVWFDSGSSWAGVLGGDEALNYPADLYLEGSDQHRGWFQSSLLTSVAANGHAPYKQVLTHGFVLDDKGMKMSKSLGNVIDPRMVISGGKDAKKDPPYGADVADVYRKIRFTLRYLLGNLSDYDPAAHAVPHAELAAADRYILARFAALVDECNAAYDSYQFYKVYQSLQRFTVLDLSNFYLDVAKDRLYINAPSAADRRACQTVLAALLEGMLPLIAPLLPHMAEDAWQNLPYAREQQSVFQAGWAGVPDEWRQLPEADAASWRAVLGIRSELNLLLEKARADKALGASLEAKVKVHVANDELRARLAALQAAGNGMDPLRYVFIVSQAELAESAAAAAEGAAYSATAQLEEGAGEVTLGVARADGAKCKRCWNYSSHVGASAAHPKLCERCLPVIEEMGFEAPPAAAPKQEAAVSA